jgi:hypothetical protein
MARAVWSRFARIRVTLSYAALLTIISLTLSKLYPALQDRVIWNTSTNLYNLGHGRVDTLLTSAFVADAGPEYEWVPGLVFLLAIGELLWLSKRLLVAMVLTHVGATLLVAAWLAFAVHAGRLPIDVATEADVGMSYCAVGVLGALTPAMPRPWRLAWTGWWLGVAIFAVVIETDFAYLGHLVALLLGIAVATRFGTPQPWTPAKLVLLILGATFGYLVLTNGVPLTVAAVAGLSGAVLGGVVTLLVALPRGPAQTNAAAEASIQSERHDSGGSSSSSPGISHS